MCNLLVKSKQYYNNALYAFSDVFKMPENSFMSSMQDTGTKFRTSLQMIIYIYILFVFLSDDKICSVPCVNIL